MSADTNVDPVCPTCGQYSNTALHMDLAERTAALADMTRDLARARQEVRSRIDEALDNARGLTAARLERDKWRRQFEEAYESDIANCVALVTSEEREGRLRLEVEQLRRERESLLDAAEHGTSLMLTKREDATKWNLYHRCEGCESAIKLLQANGRIPDVTLETTSQEQDAALSGRQQALTGNSQANEGKDDE